MADRAIMPVALDSNGDIVSGARAYFYERGTFTPLTVYSDEAAAVPHPSPVVADSAGVFPAIFTTVGFKIDIRDTEDVSLPGYPTDPGYTSPANSVGASNVLFTPIAGNAATNVQAAIQNLTTLWNNVTTFARSLLNDSTAAEMRTTLELGNLATVDILDEDDMATDSATRPPSQQSTKAYVDAEVGSVFAAKCTFNGTGTPAVISGHGVSSITDNGTGDYTLNFSPALPNANYQVFTSCCGINDATAVNAVRMIVNVKTDAGGIVLKSTTQLRITANSANGALSDVDEIYVAILV